ncbi:MAG: AAA family ATPase [Proteobacteria bacterium]|nr:AAA family ATPase [Pseudomonadota bacterium]
MAALTSKNYTLTEKIYESTASTIYRGQYEGRNSVFKRLNPDQCNPKTLARFRFEYEIGTSLQSPNVLSPVASFEIDGLPVHVFPDEGAVSLTQLLKSGPLRVSDSLQIAICLAEGIEQIHSHKFIHKDINSNNVIVTLNPVTAKIIDFGISTKLDREHQPSVTLEGLEGTINYMSPEQTGRMNRSIDYRTDFYSMGATLYEILTGRPPLTSSDSAGTIHKILAFEPASPTSLRPDLPEMIAQIVLKLLAKSPEHRYQSTFGLKTDLQRCLTQLENNKEIQPFNLGEQDFSSKFILPERLYGRESEIHNLLDCFSRAASGSNELIEIGGPSGIGKSALVQELQKPLIEKRGTFVAGKFDQFKRNVPYSAVSQAFEQLVGQVLKKDDATVESWKKSILQPIGELGQVLVEVIPSLAHLLGPQPKVFEVDPEQGRLRLNRLLGEFVGVVAKMSTPFVLFLDDVQWADSASLEVLKLIVGPAAPKGMLVIVAYRDNEVDASHPTMIALNKIKNNEANISRVAVNPLSFDAIKAYLTDTLKCDPLEVESLASVVSKKTEGNPFFIKTFLNYLYEQGVIRYDSAEHKWTWNISDIGRQAITSNVIDLLLGKMSALTESSRRSLSYAACIGPKFSLSTLTLILQRPTNETADALWPAVSDGFIVSECSDYNLMVGQSEPAPLDSSNSIEAANIVFRFAHDRIQQAAHELLPEGDREETHYRMGKTLINSLSEPEKLERIFEIVDHLNHGEGRASQNSSDRLELATLNLIAGKQAQNAGAYGPSIDYLTRSKRSLGDTPFNSDYDLSIAIYSALGRSYQATDQSQEGIAALNEVIKNAKSPMERASAYEIMSSIYEGIFDYQNCLGSALKGIAELGVKLPPTVSLLGLVFESAKMMIFFKRKVIAHIEKGGKTSDARWKMLFSIASRAMASAFLTQPNLYAVIPMRLFRLAQKEGVNVEHPTFTMFLAKIFAVLRDINSAIKLRAIARKQMQSFENPPVVALLHVVTGHWLDVIDHTYEECVLETELGYTKGVELGDLGNAGTAAFLTILNSSLGGFRIHDINEYINQYRTFFTLKQPDNYSASMFYSVAQTLRAIGGLTNSIESMSDDHITEQEIARKSELAPGNKSMYQTMRGWLMFNNKNYKDAAKLSSVNLVQLRLPGCFSAVLNLTVLSLSILRSRREGTPATNSGILSWVIVKISILEAMWWGWKFKTVGSGFSELIGAEDLRSQRKTAKALKKFQVALSKFGTAKSYYWLADTHESLGRYNLDLGYTTSAVAHLKEAISHFHRFGAISRSKGLETEFSNLLIGTKDSEGTKRGPEASVDRGTTLASAGHSVDLNSIIKASQALSGQIDLDKLTSSLLTITMENAGATHGAIVIEQDGHLHVKVTGQTRGTEVEAGILNIPVDSVDLPVPPSLVQYIRRSKEELVINNVLSSEAFKDDPYVVKHGSKSVICLPAISQGQMVAILFLENRLVEDAFTVQRVSTLRILAAQGAISLRNAGYVRDIQDGTTRISTLKSQLEKILAGTKDMASSHSSDAALRFAVKTIAEEVPIVKSASCSVVTRNLESEKLEIAQLINEGRIVRGQKKRADDSKWAGYFQQESFSGDVAGSVIVPIRWKDQTMGLLVFESAKDMLLSKEEAQFIETLTQSLGLSLKNIEHQEHLEDLVVERTAALNVALNEVTMRERKIQAILDHIDEGILTFGASMEIEAEFSAFLPKLYKVPPESIRAQDILSVIFKNAKMSPDELSRIGEVLKAIMDGDEIGWMLNADSLPRETLLHVDHDERILALDWKPMTDDAGLITKMMMTIRDVTERRSLERRIKEQESNETRKFAAVSRMLASSKMHLSMFISDLRLRTKKVTSALTDNNPNLEAVFRELHTIKGGARALKFDSLAALVHNAETGLSALRASVLANKGALDRDNFASLIDLVKDESTYLSAIFDELFGRSTSVDETWNLHTFASMAFPSVRATVIEHGLKLTKFEINDNMDFWSDDLRSSVSMMLTHCVNNAVDHGYVFPKERGQKPGPVELEISASKTGSDELSIVIQDRGAGLDMGRIRKLADEIGLSKQYADHPEEVLFETGASTAVALTLTSGRGVGLGAIRAAARELGGDVTIRNREGGGTEVRVVLPFSAVKSSDPAHAIDSVVELKRGA